MGRCFLTHFYCPPSYTTVATMLISSLCRANLGILNQKLGLIHALLSRHGEAGAKEMYKSVCPMVKASIGMHIRHSMDHMELAILAAGNPEENSELHYDLRVRGGTLETDMDLAKKRILDVSDVLREIDQLSEKESALEMVALRPTKATFFLAAEPTEYHLPSTLGRELGFVCHHAIHHMAMIKLIATNHAGLDDSDLSPDFGRAPSTIVHDHENDYS